MEADPKPRVLAEIVGPRHCIAAQAAMVFLNLSERLAERLEGGGMARGNAEELANEVTLGFLASLSGGSALIAEGVARANAAAAAAPRH
ncbi:hypothetical protein QTI33_03725 [Variovorax sp. J22P271]|uniref:hypothetical protein n=1 Tax=Variovorax davisae TaxID=3053515 RepID=UPI00257778D5|nr:hypothetical protein [Variovorax sp. J22P271]MDM0031244.1 hypothetical protein [Variovorax sp. J22P271]